MSNKFYNFFARSSLYGKVKMIFYVLGFLLSISIFSPEEIRTATHTPPLSFVIPFVICLIGIIWLILDILYLLGNKMIYKAPKNLNFNISFHFYGITLHALIVAGIIVNLVP